MGISALATIVLLMMYGGAYQPSAQIQSPAMNGRVEADITVTGLSRNLGPSKKIWVVIKSEKGSYYPHPSAAETIEGNNEWKSIGCIGPRADFGQDFEVLAVSANVKAQQLLQEKGQSRCEDPLLALPSGVQILTVIKVTRNREW